jgi:hypothetical protein
MENVTIYAFDMREISRVFISYSSGGVFTMEECVLRIAEPFAFWVSEANAWNATFVSVSKGSFQFKNVDFADITVNREGSCVVSANISSDKTCTIEGCTFTGGCLGDGNVIYVISDDLKVTETNSLIVKNSTFSSCFVYNGGVFRCGEECVCELLMFVYFF